MSSWMLEKDPQTRSLGMHLEHLQTQLKNMNASNLTVAEIDAIAKNEYTLFLCYKYKIDMTDYLRLLGHNESLKKVTK